MRGGWILLTTLLLLTLVPRGMAQPQPGPGRVEGAEALNVRSAPGLDSDTVGSLRRGEAVEVRAVEGKWARIKYRDGEGWVFARFIASQEGAPDVLSPTPNATAAATAVPGIDDAAQPPTASITAADAATASAEAVGAIRADVDRILTLTEAMHHELERQRNSPPSASSGEDGISFQSGFGLLALGAVVGFLIGTILGRQQERRGRPRVRL